MRTTLERKAAMGITTQSLAARLGALVGGQARPAGKADVVAGVRPRVVVEPASEAEVAAVLACANREGLKVLVRGGGTQLGVGFPPRGGDVLLSMTRLAAVAEHNPHDLTATVEAGIRLDALQASLASARQWLALDPILPPTATAGGIVATNATGPRRLRYGGVRDQIIGVRVALADGTIARGGGKVVKNVAGYDLPKLFTGSLGTLGVIVAATFRLYPIPTASRTVVLPGSDLAPLCALAVSAIGSTLVPTTLDVVGPSAPDGPYIFAARFESEAESAEDQADRLIALADEQSGAARKLAGEEEAQLWLRIDGTLATTSAAEAALTLKASLLPTDLAGWLAILRAAAERARLDVRWRAHAGHGLVYVRLTGAEDALVMAVDELRQAASERRGSLVVLDAPHALAERVDVWGPSPAVELMRRLKASFDPNATLNPGRFVGRI
jgi:glycolate oxidase FAD binding subunit